jgi:hypothetical protein
MKKSDIDKILDNINDGEDKNGRDKDLFGISEMTKYLIENDKIEFLTDITPEMENIFSTLHALNTKLNSKLLETYIQKRLTLRVSLKRKGRQDLVEVAKGLGVPLSLLAGLSGTDNMSMNTEGKVSKIKNRMGL